MYHLGLNIDPIFRAMSASRGKVSRSVTLTASTVRSADVAASIVSSTTSMGIAIAQCFDVIRPSPLFGGGFARKKYLGSAELKDCVGMDEQPVLWTHAEYELMDYIPQKMHEPDSERHKGGTLARVPLSLLIPLVGVEELRDLCKLHGIHVSKLHVRASLVKLLLEHHCDMYDGSDQGMGCEKSYAVLRPVVSTNAAPYQGILDVESPAFADLFKTIPIDDLKCFLSDEQQAFTRVGFNVKCVRRSGIVDLSPTDVLLENVPLKLLVKRLTIQGIRSLARHHGLDIPARWKRGKMSETLANHKCDGCRSLYFVLQAVVPPDPRSTKKNRSSWLEDHDQDAPLLWDASFDLPCEKYPPRPTTLRDMACAMRGYCDELSPGAVEELGCRICGQLTLRATAVPFVEAEYDMSLLEEDQCARYERHRPQDPILYKKGPIMDERLSSVCLDCDESMKSGKRPKLALANHLWIGDVPDCLQDLTLAEMALVTRVRYNRCVVRVSKGHSKMMANVIAFENPSKKIYERLPMSRTELSEVISVIFSGSKPPSEDDLKRTPVLVRGSHVRTALEWLKLNHVDYSDLIIDHSVLDTDYAQDAVPVGVVHNLTKDEDGNVLESAKSVFDNEPEVGSADGPCPYTVNGLTAERFGTMTPTERKLAAMRYLKNGGSSLLVGHGADPISQFNNPALYPQMFPWLFPYGCGGLGSSEHHGKISRESHIKWMLMYHDKRIQRDAGFLIVLFNHQLIRQSSHGSFLSMKRSNFTGVADEIEKLDAGVLQNISDRLAEGGRFIPQTPEEKRCARLCDQVETVGNHVDGSLARRKYQRSEIWSLINFMNSPSWFITFSPADSKHPLCLYLAGEDVEFKPKISSSSERLRLISQNPVACARFFHKLVELFVKHICGWKEDGPTRGVFGTPSGYYGTVEEQGRKTLHLHFLLWISGQLPLNEIRERIMGDDSEFIQELTEYIESCLNGEFLTGSKDEVSARVPYVPENEDRGIHTILVDTTNVPDGYTDPTLTMPEAPPTEFCERDNDCGCPKCLDLMSWWERTKLTIDDILFRSNVHTCFGRRDNKNGPAGSKKGAEVSKFLPKLHPTGKGCINKDGVCTSRFPRPVFWFTNVDRETGHLDPRKREPQLNDVNVVVTACTRCNTDLRCLLSGTAVKAIVGYVTDYITKGWLKTHQVFSTMYDAFKRHEGVFEGAREERPGSGARKMLTKIVNSLSSKMEIGAPMAALYLLRNPDHYTSHTFVPFYWKNHYNYVQNQWNLLHAYADPEYSQESEETEDVGVMRTARCSVGGGDIDELKIEVEQELGVSLQEPGEKEAGRYDISTEDDMVIDLEAGRDDVPVPLQEVKEEDRGKDEGGRVDPVVSDVLPDELREESIRMSRTKGFYLAKSSTDDYRCRPDKMGDVCLYDYVQCSIKHPIHSSRVPRQDLQFYRFIDEHPQSHSHAVALDPERRLRVVPNFLGGTLPRKDVGDREDYCCAMLTLFCPWRTGVDLKSAESSWEETFDSYNFTERQKNLMANFNMRYECYDARDDYAAVLRVKGTKGCGDADDDEDEGGGYADNGENVEDDDDEIFGEMGQAAQQRATESGKLMWALRAAGWRAAKLCKTTLGLGLPNIALDDSLRSVAWNNIIKVEKLRAWKRKIGALGKENEDEDGDRMDLSIEKGEVLNDAVVVPSSYLSKDFKPSEACWAEMIDRTVGDANLNEGQEKAFRIVANHACCVAPEQLLMHLGGMGGTGKSTVIKALCDFFTARDETYRFVLLGPTGTSAALIGGSTYHSFLGLNNGRSARGDPPSKVEEIRERLTGVGYLFIDEVSMLDCRALCAISARCCEALGVFEKPFGGLNVILSGDFAQLPPVQGNSLYSRKVALRQCARQSIADQENTIGKLIWLQFTTVVVLTENMRQTANWPEEVAFRNALVNLRWRNCSEADKRLIRSRLAGTREGLSVEAEGYREVSIITARNLDKDQINEANSAKFAAEHGQTLTDFYSVDCMSSAEPNRGDRKRRARKYCSSRSLTRAMQSALWHQTPCTSEQIPGRLRLCRGMPVIIRYNHATELCMTRGQEARVVGWSAVRVPRHKGKRCIDVLYVELVNPPHDVKIPNLPKNVVPLTRNSQSIDAQLPNDEYVSLSRSQVSVLPNFAMTDYSSQGKTRPWNVVDLAECRSFQAAYTCLSRGISLGQTLIMRDFPDELLCGKLDGALRQEYRELEHLSVITDLTYRGLLPKGIVQRTRWETLDLYKSWKLSAGSQVDNAPTLYEDPLLVSDPEYSRPAEGVAVEHTTLSSVAKRKAETSKKVVPVKRRKGKAQAVLANASWDTPVGPLWDDVDWSCPFDVWVSILYWLWVGDRVKWSRVLKKFSLHLCEMVEGFEGMNRSDPEQEVTIVRDQVRSTLREAHPVEFPEGSRGVDIMSLTERLMGYRGTNSVDVRCAGCGGMHGRGGGNGPNGTIGPFTAVRRARSIQEFFDLSFGEVGRCEDCGGTLIVKHRFSELLALEVADSGDVELDPWVQVGDWGLYRLAGVVYYGEFHFVSRILDRNGKVYTHDGVEGGSAVFEGVMGNTLTTGDLIECHGKRPSLALYVLADRRAMVTGEGRNDVE